MVVAEVINMHIFIFRSLYGLGKMPKKKKRLRHWNLVMSHFPLWAIPFSFSHCLIMTQAIYILRGIDKTIGYKLSVGIFVEMANVKLPLWQPFRPSLAAALQAWCSVRSPPCVPSQALHWHRPIHTGQEDPSDHHQTGLRASHLLRMVPGLGRRLLGCGSPAESNGRCGCVRNVFETEQVQCLQCLQELLPLAGCMLTREWC